MSSRGAAIARWEPNARERLERAALTLFAEDGYDVTTVAEIADRAGLTKSTFFLTSPTSARCCSAGRTCWWGLFNEAIRIAPPTATTADRLGRRA